MLRRRRRFNKRVRHEARRYQQHIGEPDDNTTQQKVEQLRARWLAAFEALMMGRNRPR